MKRSAAVLLLPGLAAQGFSLVVWQSGLIVQKLLVAQSNIGTLMLLQLAGAALVMWAFLAAIGGLPRMSRRSLLNVCWGLMAPGLAFALGIAGAARTDGASVALIWGLFPLIAPVIARVLIGEPLNRMVVAGGLITLAAVGLLTVVRADSGTSDPLGNLLVLAAVTTASLNAVIGRVMNRGPARWYQVATLQVTGAVVAGVGLTLVTGWSPPALDRPEQMAALGYLVLFMTVGNFFAYNLALTRIPVAWIGLGGAISPIIGLASARILLGTPVGAAEIGCAGLIAAGVAVPIIASMLKSRRRDAAPPQSNR